ncbi:hypothetical protein DFH28DRAFT_598066 [Melampsora americana]|nr:hypothetical protein DFH28DRAFT_598066 [Melampsora americana]
MSRRLEVLQFGFSPLLYGDCFGDDTTFALRLCCHGRRFHWPLKLLFTTGSVIYDEYFLETIRRSHSAFAAMDDVSTGHLSYCLLRVLLSTTNFFWRRYDVRTPPLLPWMTFPLATQVTVHYGFCYLRQTDSLGEFILFSDLRHELTGRGT